MGLQVTRSGLVTSDSPRDDTQFVFGGTDRIDISSVSQDVRLVLADPMGRWLEDRPIRVRDQSFRSITGLAQSYPPRGVSGFRISNWNRGIPAVVDLEAYSVVN